jgi:hypothetical protein
MAISKKASERFFSPTILRELGLAVGVGAKISYCSTAEAQTIAYLLRIKVRLCTRHGRATTTSTKANKPGQYV